MDSKSPSVSTEDNDALYDPTEDDDEYKLTKKPTHYDPVENDEDELRGWMQAGFVEDQKPTSFDWLLDEEDPRVLHMDELLRNCIRAKFTKAYNELKTNQDILVQTGLMSEDLLTQFEELNLEEKNKQT